MGLPGSPV
ncbi:unnamed protein product, partial [Didymodactylos carnosus]